ncbi:MAG: HDOD domain-containing protein [Candidatus Hydrogenedentes bacterium]|nr:HDOD domain-containing protein [Candidatus Hydrogenedentota bacterium]
MANCPFCNTPPPAAYTSTERCELFACGACFNPYIIRRDGNSTAGEIPENTQDIRLIAPEGSLGHAILSILPQAFDKLPVMPEISMKILQMLRDPEMSMTDLATLIRQDPVVALTIMKLANSPVYGGLQEIKDLNAACARLGSKTIANTVQVVANSNLFITGDKRLKNVMRALWRHSVATAHCAFEVAKLLAEPRAESLFLGGLLHDIGKVVLLDIVTGSYSGAIASLRMTPELLDEVVQSFHPLVGLHLAQHWDLPPEFGAIAYAHHEPERAPREDWLPLAHIVSMANAVAKVEGYGMRGKEDILLLSHPSARYLNFNDMKLATLRVDISEKLEALLDASG